MTVLLMLGTIWRPVVLWFNNNYPNVPRRCYKSFKLVTREFTATALKEATPRTPHPHPDPLHVNIHHSLVNLTNIRAGIIPINLYSGRPLHKYWVTYRQPYNNEKLGYILRLKDGYKNTLHRPTVHCSKTRRFVFKFVLEFFFKIISGFCGGVGVSKNLSAQGKQSYDANFGG